MKKNKKKSDIRRLRSSREKEMCAALMAGHDPWKRLQRGYSTCLAIFNQPGLEKYVLRRNGALAGFLLINMRGVLRGYIQSIFVHPAFQNQGLGARLMAFAEKRIFSEAPNVFLLVSSFNRRAERFYRRLGYQKVGELKDFVVGGYAEKIFRKTRGPLVV